MKPALILAALLAGTASAQVADKAAHAGVSAVIGTVAREATDSKAAAFLATLAVGAAKESYDAQQPGNRFSRGDLAADVLGAALVTLGPKPDVVGVIGHSWHFSNGTKQHLTNNTPGLLLSWSADWLPWDRGYVDAAIYSNSQGGSSFYAGLSKEWRVLPRVYAGVGAGAVWGYRRLEHDDQTVPCSSVGAGDLVYGRIAGWCLKDHWGPPRWSPAVLARARVELGYGLSVMATYMPAHTLAKALHADQGKWKNADAVSVGVTWRRTW